MLGDDLNKPLGLDREEPLRAWDVPWGAVALGGIGALAVGLFVFSRIIDDGQGGEPIAVASIERPLAPASSPQPAGPPGLDASPTASTTAAANRPAGPGQDVEIENGVRVVRNGGGRPPGSALIIQVPEALGLELPAAPDRRLIEKSPHGLLPKIGADGARPAQVYARPLIESGKLSPDAPRIALVVGGMGISQTATDHALDMLPGPVTLAFAPYGSDPAGLAGKARSRGHELVLQVAMEPFEGGQAPGPRMLMTEASVEQNLDNLHWAMARLSGYVGVMNFLGAKFTGQESAVTPVLRDIAARGLLWLDDGTSARSLVRDAAGGLGLTALQAQVSLDPAKGEGLDPLLAKLEALAREKGSAIGVANGLPATVDRLADFTRGLEKRGIALVPLSALAAETGRTAASRPKQ